MDKNSRILIQGGYGFRNWGDDLQLYNNVKLLKKEGFTNIKILAPSDYIKDLCQCNIVPSTHSLFPKMVKGNSAHLFQQFCLVEGALINKRIQLLSKKYQNFIEEIEKCDVFLFSGSGTINTRHLYGLMIFLTPLMIASYFNKPIVLSGQGFTPMNNTKLEQFIGRILNKTKKIYTRDFDKGMRALRKTGVDMSKVEKGIDDAFTSPKIKTNIPSNTIGINISCFIVPRLYQEFYDLGIMLKKNGFNPVFNYFQSEHRLIENITKGDFEVYNFKSPEDVVGFHNDCLATVSMRYHSMLLSLAGQTPTINLSRDEYQYSKIKAIIDNTGIENLSLKFAQVNSEIMYNHLLSALEKQPNKLKEIEEKWKPKGNLAIKYIKECSNE
jgi:polysaccharide pyruvyl transferase WcaK-like protein